MSLSSEAAGVAPHVRTAHVVGIGVVGGSIAAGLRERGWFVSGEDLDATRAEAARKKGIIDHVGVVGDPEICIIATPVSAIVSVAKHLLASTTAVVTDVGSVKAEIVDRLNDERFVGGHPMAGSEQSGLEGVDGNLFEGAAWVLTSVPHVGDSHVGSDSWATLRVREMIEALGAIAIDMTPNEHDRAVATISHVPHLAAAMLMRVALEDNEYSEAALRLAAGGFRDMTRIAAGSAALWSDIIFSNKRPVLDALDQFVAQCQSLRDDLARNASERVQKKLAQASMARRQLPARKGRPSQFSVVHIPIPDKPGALGAVLQVFSEQQVNVEDLELSHDPKGDRGTLSVTVARTHAPLVANHMNAIGIAVGVEVLES